VAIEIEERFCVEAPIDSVWRFMKDPEQIVTCMPGASLDEVVDARTYLGTVKVKLGAVTTRYKGRVELAEVDDASHTVRLLAEGRETAGGTARGTLSSRLVSLPDDRTEVVAEGDLDVTGRVLQVGRGMIRGVSQQFFQEFAASAKERLEALEAAAADDRPAPAFPPAAMEPVRILPLLVRTLWAAITRFAHKVGRWFGRRKPGDRPLAHHTSSDQHPSSESER
jgi:carbon monoxide dehydrogenase subunit G